MEERLTSSAVGWSNWRRAVTGMAGLGVVLDLVVMGGWLTHATAIVQVQTQFAPMQFNTALGFVIGGLGLILWSFDRVVLTRICATLIGLIGAASSLEYFLHRNLGIDFLIFRSHLVTPQAPFAGRPAPLTCVCFVALSIVLLLLASRRLSAIWVPVAGIVSLVVGTVSTVICLGHLTGVNTVLGFGGLTQMAIHTAWGFVTLGFGGFLASMDVYSANKSSMGNGWIAAAASIAMLIATVFAWWALRAQENIHQSARLTEIADFVRDDVAEQVFYDSSALNRMALRWDVGGRPNKSVWDADAAAYAKDLKFQAVEWVDPSMHVRWVQPITGNEKVLNFNVLAGGRRQDAVLTAVRNRAITVSRPIDLIQGGKGFLIYVPISVRGRFDGLIVGVCKVSEIVAGLPSYITKLCTVEVLEGGQVIYAPPSVHRVTGAGPPTQVTFAGVTWDVQLGPTREMLATYRTPLPQMVLVGGILIAALLGIMIRVIQIMRQTTEDLRLSQQTISDFAVVLEFQKNQLESVNSELEQIATTDALTGAKNRRAFDERLAAEASQAKRHALALSLILVDVDHFKRFNDEFGHLSGDVILREVANVLQSSARESDFVARYGGEEFVVLCSHTDIDGAVVVAERMRAAIAEKKWDYRQITASFGVATFTPSTMNTDALFKKADDALYTSKANGRNLVTAKN